MTLLTTLKDIADRLLGEDQHAKRLRDEELQLAAAAVLVHASLVDGHADPEERRKIKSLLQTRLNLGDDQFARAFVRDVVSGAEFVEHRRAAHAMEGLERPRLIVDPGVDDPAVARRSPHAQTRRRFKQEHVVVIA